MSDQCQSQLSRAIAFTFKRLYTFILNVEPAVLLIDRMCDYGRPPNKNKHYMQLEELVNHVTGF